MPTLYCFDVSCPSRAVLMTAAALNVPLDRRIVNTLEGDQLKPEFIKLNPQHSVPLLEEDDFVLGDSHAISCYLVDKYGKDDSLYPKDFQKRALVNWRLHFNCGVMFPAFIKAIKPILNEGDTTVAKALSDAVQDAYGMLDAFLEGRRFAIGDQVTIADFHLVTTVTQVDIIVPINETRYKNVVSWIGRMRKLPYYDENQRGLEGFAAIIKSKMIT